MYEREWRTLNAYPKIEDDPSLVKSKRWKRNKKLMEYSNLKDNGKFHDYFEFAADYLKKYHKLEFILMIDDLDRLQSERDAKAICDCAFGFASAIKVVVPIMISIREETMAKLDDSVFAPKVSIIPPSFSKVLNKRLEIFLRDYNMSKDQIEKSGYDTEKVKIIIKHIIESILDNETYSNLVLFHYDLDILLDVVRSVIRSPFIHPEYILDLQKKGNKIPWHIILDTMQRYQYKNFYDENSFILNIFDNDQSVLTTANTLIRFRLLQVLRYRFRGLNKPIPLGEIYADMEQLGYSQDNVILALTAFARQRIIITGRNHNIFAVDLHDFRDILIQQTPIYYLDTLIFEYRYLQNILSVTHLPFTLPFDMVESIKPISGRNLRVVSEYIGKFIGYITECEKIEGQCIKNKNLFDTITRREILSKKMRHKLNEEIRLMINY